jgi:hypothetical protein
LRSFRVLRQPEQNNSSNIGVIQSDNQNTQEAIIISLKLNPISEPKNNIKMEQENWLITSAAAATILYNTLTLTFIRRLQRQLAYAQTELAAAKAKNKVLGALAMAQANGELEKPPKYAEAQAASKDRGLPERPDILDY